MFATVRELRDDALFLAGEATDESSDFTNKAVDYLNAVQTTLISGGPLGGAVVNAVDWLWALKSPRGVVTVEPLFSSGVITAAVTIDSDSVTLSADPGISLIGYRLIVPKARQKPLILTHSGTDLTINGDWVEASGTSVFTARKSEYPLPSDFQRFASPLDGGDGHYINVQSSVNIEQEAPFGEAAFCYAAALAGPQLLRVRGTPRQRTVFEYDYVIRPDELTLDGDDPIVPLVHRRVLSLGAGYLILLDKRDDTSASIYQQLATAWDAMEREQNLNYRNGSRDWGRFVPPESSQQIRRHWGFRQRGF